MISFIPQATKTSTEEDGEQTGELQGEEPDTAGEGDGDEKPDDEGAAED